MYLYLLTKGLCDGLRNFNHSVVRSNKVPLIVYYVIKNLISVVKLEIRKSIKKKKKELIKLTNQYAIWILNFFIFIEFNNFLF